MPSYAGSIFGPAGLTPESEWQSRRPWPIAVSPESREFRQYSVYFRDSLRPDGRWNDDVYRRVEDHRYGFSDVPR